MDKTRLNKISRLIQKDLSDYFQKASRSLFGGVMVSVTVVRVTPDLSIAKVYVSVFPSEKQDEVMKTLKIENSQIRGELGSRVRHQLRKIPELQFYIDDSLDYAQRINDLLKK